MPLALNHTRPSNQKQRRPRTESHVANRELCFRRYQIPPIVQSNSQAYAGFPVFATGAAWPHQDLGRSCYISITTKTVRMANVPA